MVRLVPVWVGIRDKIAIRIQRLGGLVCGGAWSWRNGAGCGSGLDDLLLRSGWLWLAVETPDLELFLVLFQDGFIVVLPELLRRVFAGDTLENCTEALAQISLIRRHG